MDVPQKRIHQAKQAAEFLGHRVYSKQPFLEGMSRPDERVSCHDKLINMLNFSGAKPASNDLLELLLNQTWRPQLTVIGASGLPPPETAGNVLRKDVAVKLSVRYYLLLTLHCITQNSNNNNLYNT